MVNRHLYVGHEELCHYPPRKKIYKIFKRYGKLEQIIFHPQSHKYLFVVYESHLSAYSCLKDKNALYRKHRLIIEQAEIQDDEDDPLDVDEAGEDAGPQDIAMPSLMMLNDDCLLHILSFMGNRRPIESSCLRMRRLSKSLSKKLTHFWISYRYRNIDHIFHYGPLIRHLGIHGEEEFPFDETIYLASLRCNKLEHLSLELISFSNSTVPYLNKLVRPVKELRFDGGCMERNLDGILENATQLQKLRINNFSRSYTFTTSFVQTSYLTTILMPDTLLDIGKILTDFPALVALSCDINDDSSPLPENHNLNQFHGCVYSDTGHINLKKIANACRNIRHLRVEEYGDFLGDFLPYFPPLEGLCLPKFSVERLSDLPDTMKILIFDTVDCEETFPLAVLRFSQLEALYWNNHWHGDLSVMLGNRASEAPLTIVSCFEEKSEYKMLLPSLKWRRDCEDAFGTFSIYSSF